MSAQHHQHEVAVERLLRGELAGIERPKPPSPVVLAAFTGLDRSLGHVRQQVVVLREPQVAREGRCGLEPVGSQLSRERVEGPVAGRDRHEPTVMEG
jgi:hypothetical protein